MFLGRQKLVSKQFSIAKSASRVFMTHKTPKFSRAEALLMLPLSLSHALHYYILYKLGLFKVFPEKLQIFKPPKKTGLNTVI